MVNVENQLSVINDYEFEMIERNSWIDIYKSAHLSTIKFCGINFTSFGTADASMVSAVDILAFNRVIGLGFDGNITESLLDDIICEYKRNNTIRFFLQLHPNSLTDKVKELLNKKGFNYYNNWCKLYRDNSSVKPTFSLIDIKRIFKGNADVFADILVSSFGWDSKLKQWFINFVDRNNWIHYIGYYNGKPVSTASLYIEGKYGWLGFGATLPEYRGLGAQHALIAQRLTDGIRLGCEHFIVETAEPNPERKVQSYNNLIDMGFKPAYSRPNYIYNNCVL